MSVFCPNGGSIKLPAPSASNGESVIALPNILPAANVCRIVNAPAGTRVLFGDQSVSFAGNKAGMLLNTVQADFYVIPDGATHASFTGGGNTQQNINVTVGQMVSV